MLIQVQREPRCWNVQTPQHAAGVRFRNGATAFDFAQALAREHHLRTGETVDVWVVVGDAHVAAGVHGS